MGITVRWDDANQTILRYTFKGWWSGQELYQVITEQTAQLIARVNHPIYAIFDFRQTLWLPPESIFLAVHLFSREPANARELIILGLNPILRAAISGTRRAVSRGQVLEASSIDEAYQLISNLKSQPAPNPEPTPAPVPAPVPIPVAVAAPLETIRTVAASLQTMQPPAKGSAFPALERDETIILTTFDKRGQGAATPIWFTLMQDKIYILTPENSGKVARVKHNPNVIVAPDNGQNKGIPSPDKPSIKATVKVIEDTPSAEMGSSWLKKYAARGTAMRAKLQLEGQKLVWLEITPRPQ